MNDASPSISSSPNALVSQDEISRHAQELWEKYGRPSGRDEEIWLEAERSLWAQHSARSFSQPAEGAGSPPVAPATRAGRAGGAAATPRMPGSRSRKG